MTLGNDGNYFDITGTTTITSIASKAIGTVIRLHFDGILTLTHDAADLILPGAANIITAVGDHAEFIEYATGDWRCFNYQRASGQALVSVAFPGTVTAIDDGSDLIVDDTDTVVSTFTIVPGGVPFARISLTDDVVFQVREGDTANAPNADNGVFECVKTATANQYDLHIHCKDAGSASRNFDWLILQLEP